MRGHETVLRALLLSALAWAAGSPVVCLAAEVPASATVRSQPLPLMSVPGAGERLLIVAPHPDDESLCCAGLLRHAVQQGASVGVVWVTAGDGFELDALLLEHTLSPGSAAMQRLGRQRLQEARAAADALGVPRAAQYVLGYPDRGLEALLGGYFNRAYRSRYTANASVHYPEAVSPGAAYTGANLQRDLGQVLADFRPTLVLTAAPQDVHPDHRACGEFVRRLLQQRGQLGALRYWIIHAPGSPRPYGLHTELPLTVPDGARTLGWQQLPLDAAQRSAKQAALRRHRSQMRIMAPFMNAFVRSNELFAGAN